MNVDHITNLEEPTNNFDSETALSNSINFQDFEHTNPSMPSGFPELEFTNLNSALERCGTNYSCAKSVIRHEDQLAQVEPEPEVKEIEPLDGKLNFPTDDDSWINPQEDSPNG